MHFAFCILDHLASLREGPSSSIFWLLGSLPTITSYGNGFLLPLGCHVVLPTAIRYVSGGGTRDSRVCVIPSYPVSTPRPTPKIPASRRPRQTHPSHPTWEPRWDRRESHDSSTLTYTFHRNSSLSRIAKLVSYPPGQSRSVHDSFISSSMIHPLAMEEWQKNYEGVIIVLYTICTSWDLHFVFFFFFW